MKSLSAKNQRREDLAFLPFYTDGGVLNNGYHNFIDNMVSEKKHTWYRTQMGRAKNVLVRSIFAGALAKDFHYNHKKKYENVNIQQMSANEFRCQKILDE